MENFPEKLFSFRPQSSFDSPSVFQLSWKRRIISFEAQTNDACVMLLLLKLLHLTIYVAAAAAAKYRSLSFFLLRAGSNQTTHNFL